MKTIIQWVFLVAVCVSSAGAQNVYHPFKKQKSIPDNLKMSLQNSIGQYHLLTVDRNVVSSLIKNRPSEIQLEFPLTEKTSVLLDMERYDILAPNARIVAGTDNGDIPVNVSNPVVSYKLKWNGGERRLAVLNFSNKYINGAIEAADGDIYELGALKGFKNEQSDDFIIYPISHLKDKPTFTCGAESDEVSHDVADRIEWVKNSKQFDVATSTLLVNNVAVEMDYQAYQYYGSVENASAYILTLFSLSSAIYNRDINTMFNVTFIRVWTTSSDPYTDNPASSSTLLNEFRNYWNVNMRHVPRTIAHYASPRNQGLGGVAWVGALCSSINSGYGYGFSDIQGANTITPLPTYTWQAMVVTHEIGHNYGSPHTHSCDWNPPIDTCYFGVETQGCVTGTGCTLNNVCIPRLGTIMSYCHLSSPGSQLIFGPLPTALIRSYAEGAACMSASVNPIKVGQPNGVEQYSTRTSATSANPTTLITWGSSLTDPVHIRFSADSGQTWQQIASNIPSGTREYTWSIPYVQTTNNALIRVMSSIDTTKSDTSDTPFGITLKLWSFSNLSPVTNTTILVDSGDYTPYTFLWNRTGDIDEIYYKLYLKKRTGTVPTAKFLSANNGSDTSVTLTAHDIDSTITSWGLWSGDSIQCHWYAVAFNDPDTLRVNLRFNITFRKSPSVDIHDNNPIHPTDYVLLPAYPNPFNPSTTITYGIPENSYVRIKIYNMLGQEIRTLVSGIKNQGVHSVSWDGSGQNGQKVSSGIYIFTLETEKAIRVRKMTLLK